MKRAKRLEDLPNVGSSLAADLRRVGVHRPQDLKGRDPLALYQALCAVSGGRQDPCVLDVFTSAVRFVEGGKARPWWYFTTERKHKYPGSLTGTSRTLCACSGPCP